MILNRSIVKTKKSLILILVKNSDSNYLLVTGKGIYKFKVYKINGNFPTQFCPGTISGKSDAVKSRERSFKRNAYIHRR